MCTAHACQVNFVFDVPTCTAAFFTVVALFRGECWVKDFVQAQLLGQTLLPACFGPPAHDVFADAVEVLVALDHVEDPVRKEVDVRIAVGGEHFDSAMLSNQAVPDRKPFLLFGNVAECIRRRGVKQPRDVWSQ